MTQIASTHRPALCWLTVVAIASIAISLNVAFHEGVHALTCIGVGSDLQEYSALHVACNHVSAWQGKVEAGSASIANLILGTVCWLLLTRIKYQSPSMQFFLWLFMLMNWLYGAGYWMFSGVANIGDWAVVIEGWEPHWLWRVGMLMAGAPLFMFFVWLALRELGKFIGGTAPEQIGRAAKLGFLAYLASALIPLLAGLFNPYGLLGLPTTAGIMAALGALSPLLWMMQWFRAKSFTKLAGPPLVIQGDWRLIALAGLTVVIYAYVLGRTLYF